jgi:adenylyltransferase/sulfurtransferase
MSERIGVQNARILIVGVGRLGSRAAKLLCEAGIKHLTLCDYDVVLEQNLGEQPLYTKEDIGKPKVEATASRLKSAHPNMMIDARNEQFSSAIVEKDTALIIDGTDNLETRMLLNDVAKSKGIPLVIATATKERGMVFMVLPQQNTPCWQCVSKGKVAGDDCASGIDNAIADTVAKTQVDLALSFLRGEHDRAPDHASSELLLIDKHRVSRIGVNVNPLCAACQGRYEHLDAPFHISFCASRERIVARPNAPRVLNLMVLAAKERVLRNYGSALLLQAGQGTALVHKHGAIEFTDVERMEAMRFAQRILS